VSSDELPEKHVSRSYSELRAIAYAYLPGEAWVEDVAEILERDYPGHLTIDDHLMISRIHCEDLVLATWRIARIASQLN